MPDRPNIVYLFTDQQSALAMSCAGNPDLHTPHLDALARRGTRFSRAYCSDPLCTPCRATMFTGLMPSQSGLNVNNLAIPDEIRPTEVGRVLRDAGYACGYGGKWHVPDYNMAEPETHGFDLYAPFGDATLADSAIRYLNDHRDGPFFLVASFDNPHNICEWSRGQRLPWGSIDERPLEHCPNLPPNFAAPPFESEFLRNWISHAFVTFATQHYTPDQWRRYRNAYYRLVERVDAEIGKVLAAIDELGLADDTLVVFASDHGDGEGAHRWSNKQALYEECIRVPLILTGPGVQTGRVVDTPVAAALDLMPTLCDAAGASMPEGRLGRSLLPAAAGDDLPARDVVVETTIEGRVNGKAMIGERYKYVCYSHGRHREALHDLHADPGEMVNLALEARHAEQLQACRDALERWCDQTGSTWASQIPRVQDRRLAER